MAPIPAIVWVDLASSITLVGVGIYRFRLMSREFKLLLTLFIIIAIVNTAVLITASRGINNLWIMHLYTLAEFGLVTAALSHWVPQTHFLRRYLPVVIAAFVSIWIIAKLVVEDVNSFDTFTAGLSHLLIIAIAVYILSRHSQSNLHATHKLSHFLVLATILVYYTGDLLWVSLLDVLSQNASIDTLMMAFTLHWGLDIIANMIYAGGFLCLARR